MDLHKAPGRRGTWGTRLSAWRPEDLLDGGAHVVECDAATVRALAGGLPERARLTADPGTLREVRGTAAPLLSRIADDIAARLDATGPGLALVDGEGLSDLTDGQLSSLVFGISVLLGRPVPQNRERELVVPVLDEHPADVERARGYRTNGRMLMHTDPTDVAGLLCLRESDTGGESLYASSGAVLDELSTAAPDLVHCYFSPWHWDLRGMQRVGADRIVRSPIFGVSRGVLSCRYGSLLVREGMRRIGSLDTPAVAALDLFEEAARQPHLVLRLRLGRGQSIWLNNHRVLHGREAFKDDNGTGRVRHLLRTWIWSNEPPPLPPGFLAFCNAIDAEVPAGPLG
ncbi:TauD/TfdA family dioxygenase [Streptomyces sp. NPDC091027]|uniref:TauD/TfdA family dioxygenase n=1 Tax=Streptomyces sp. NPDC091027 TaxID=3365971 RepID=UPI00380B7EF4